MRCPRCHHENREEARFCAACGSALAAQCPACGHQPPPGAAFCDHCGRSLTGTTTAAILPPLVARPQTPQVSTPPYLVEKILQSRPTLEGERKRLTVLFADLKGSMELLVDRDPEEARAILDPVLERMMAAVHRYEGTVNQVMGDGIMALFGAPIAHEDHAVRACYATLAMQAAVKQYAGEVQRTRGVPIQIRVGLNSGEVVVRSIGNDLHMDYTAVGQTTHLAARMEQLAMPGSILITPEVFQLAEGHIQVTSLGPVPIKGLTAPVEVSEVTGAGHARTRLQAAAVGSVSFRALLVSSSSGCTLSPPKGGCEMRCSHCQSTATTERAGRPELGYRRFRCRDYRRGFNERTGTPFNRLQYPTDVVSLVVLWRVRYKLSLRDVAEMFLQRGIIFTHEAVREWERKLAPLISGALRKRRSGMVGTSWYVDETYVKVQERWCYLSRAIDRDGHLIDVRLSDTRDLPAAEAFFRSAWAVTGVTPDRITTDGHDAYPRAIRQVFGTQVRHRTNRYLNNHLEQDHRGIKQRYRPTYGLKTFATAARFCHVFDEIRAFLRPQCYRNQLLTLAQRRRIHQARFTELTGMMAVA
jgi:putative transposase